MMSFLPRAPRTRLRRPTAVPSWIGLVSATLLLASLLTGCAPKSGATEPDVEDGAAEATEEALPVAAFPLSRGSIESVLRYSSNLEAERSVAVLAEADRRVTELVAEEGNWVEKGDVLLRLQNDEQESALAKARSQLDKALREYERQQRLYDQELISEQAFSDATYEKEQLEIAVEDAERELQYATVRAPISGRVTQRLVNLGDHVQAGMHLFDIVDFSSIVARIFVPEKELKRLGPGQEARLMTPALGSGPRAARILRIAPTVDSKSGTVKVTLAIPDREGLRPGMFVEVDLIADVDEDALLVPKRALVYDEDQTFVFRVTGSGEDARVERLLVEPTLENRNFVKVSEGLAVGDRVVVAGQAGLKEGTRVRLLDLEEAVEAFGDGRSVEELAETFG